MIKAPCKGCTYRFYDETGNAVEIVKCKDCNHYIAGFCTRDINGRTNMFRMSENDYCSYGERKADKDGADDETAGKDGLCEQQGHCDLWNQAAERGLYGRDGGTDTADKQKTAWQR